MILVERPEQERSSLWKKGMKKQIKKKNPEIGGIRSSDFPVFQLSGRHFNRSTFQQNGFLAVLFLVE